MLELERIRKQLERQKDRHLYRVRKARPYRFPSGYMSWDTLSAIVTTSAYSESQAPDRATKITARRTALWLVQDAPVYAVTEDLLQSLIQTDLEVGAELLQDFDPPLPTFLLLFPNRTICDPLGDALNYCVVHFSDVALPEHSRGEDLGLVVNQLQHDFDRELNWGGTSMAGTVWFSGFGINSDGIVQTTGADFGATALNATDLSFIERVRSIVLQLCLVLQYEPELLEDMSALDLPQSNGFAPRQRAEKTERVRYPRWLGQPGELGKATSRSLGGTHNSPHRHWRKGHWRRVVCGVGRTGRRWMRFPPTLVNATAKAHHD